MIEGSRRLSHTSAKVSRPVPELLLNTTTQRRRRRHAHDHAFGPAPKAMDIRLR